MARGRVHEGDAVLDAARSVVLDGGVRAATIAAISARSGAPSGSIYHAFSSRDGVLAAVWRRATTRSQSLWLEAGATRPEDPVEAGVAMALSQLELARTTPDDVRLLTVLRPEDFGSVELDLGTYNKPIREGLRALAARLDGADAQLRAHLATIELPYGALQVRLGGGSVTVPPQLDVYIAAAARAVLTAPPTPQPGERQ